MEWQFRKILQSIETYRMGSYKYMAQIQNGNSGVLRTIVRQIQLIISDHNSNILSKVLAMRFARDIMILGKQDIINQLSKLVPHMLKVCSYKLESKDLNRGQTYFEDHPQYINASASQKQQIERYGSTYFILNVQSIYHWGTWIKVDENGNQSIYSKGLQSLIDRGVYFHNNFNYYKNSDTQKFKNTYKVQFFSEDSVDLNESRQSSASRLNRSDVSERIKDTQNIQDIQGIKVILKQLQQTPAKRYDKLQYLNRNVINILQNKYKYSQSAMGQGKNKLDKQWLEQFIVQYRLLENNKIPYQQFMRRASIETVEIGQKSEIAHSSVQQQNGFRKNKSSAKRQLLQKNISENGNEKSPDKILQQQQQAYKQLKQQYRLQIKKLNQRLEQQKLAQEQEKRKIADSFQQRVRVLKYQIGNKNANKNQSFIKQNQKLKEKLYDLQKSLQISRSREGNAQHIAATLQSLKAQNQSLRKTNRKDESLNANTYQLNEKVRKLERELESAKKQNQIILQKTQNQQQINKKNKQLINLNDQINIYKNSIKQQRQQFVRKYNQLQSKYKELQNQLKNLKIKNHELQKKLDLKDIQAVEITQHLKAVKQMSREKQITSNHKSKFDNNANSQSRQQFLLTHQNNSQSNLKQSIIYDFKKYENVRNEIYKNEKQRFLRFCRCSLKKKDLLLKQNQLEIGLISEPLSNNSVKYVLHLTNISSSQINEVHIRFQSNTNQYFIEVETQFLFCIQSGEQQKIRLFLQSINNFMGQKYQPIFLVINYVKNSRNYQVKLLFPFLMFKTIEIYKPDKNAKISSQDQLTQSFTFSQKMLSDQKYLYSFFPSIQQTAHNKYECDLLFRYTNTRFRLIIIFKQNNKLSLILSPLGQYQNNQREQQLIGQDIMGFLQLCFRK